MKFWGLIVASLYVLILVIVFPPVLGLLELLAGGGNNPTTLGGFLSGYSQLFHDEPRGSVILIVVALVAQAALLSVPVEISDKRPVTKRTIVPLVLSTSLATVLLIFGSVTALTEVFKTESQVQWTLFAFYGFLWVFWAIIFFRRSKKTEPMNFVERQCRWLFRGSILELLIAVPSHIYVRQRHECCAGIGTGIGIACGIAVMLFSFGPGVFFLFKERIDRKRKGMEAGQN